MRFRLLETNPRSVAWSYTSIEPFERALREAGVRTFRNEPSVLAIHNAKLLARLGLVRTLARGRPRAYFTPLMGPNEHRLFPTTYASRSLVYCYDCWQPDYPLWDRIFRRHDVAVAFFSARQSARYFAERHPRIHCHWLPEATDPEPYRISMPLAKRVIDVLELGRRHEALHDAIAPPLSERGYVHRYELARGQVVFPTREELHAGLRTSRVSVLYPSSVTHPERSGNVETLTQKYLESIAAGCIAFGHCPAELEELFGYNPVIEADPHDPTGQLIDILQHPDRHQADVDANRRRLLEVGTWKVRTARLLELLAGHGYTP